MCRGLVGRRDGVVASGERRRSDQPAEWLVVDRFDAVEDATQRIAFRAGAGVATESGAEPLDIGVRNGRFRVEDQRVAQRLQIAGRCEIVLLPVTEEGSVTFPDEPIEVAGPPQPHRLFDDLDPVVGCERMADLRRGIIARVDADQYPVVLVGLVADRTQRLGDDLGSPVHRHRDEDVGISHVRHRRCGRRRRGRTEGRGSSCRYRRCGTHRTNADQRHVVHGIRCVGRRRQYSLGHR